ncbi:MAG: histidinol-phosphate transaminase [Halofilum sp. (in: g-proteobacteria)]|nr:histidinol-phosphate transaminase [Halofilum sp. (in: g-proteobacteria)]
MPCDPVDLAVPGVRGLAPYEPGKPIETLAREHGLDPADIVKLASNENPRGPSPQAVTAARAVLDEVHRYPDGNATGLREHLAARHSVEPEAITLGNGSNDVLDMIARTFLGPGRNAVFSRHAFAVYPIATSAAGAEARVAEPQPGDHPQVPHGHDLDAMAALIDDDTRVVFVANPNNPTGTWVDREALERFLARVPDHVIVVLDEAYSEYVREPEFPNGLCWLPRHANLVVTHTFSKIHGLAGLRCGYALSTPAVADLLNRVRHPFNVNTAALAAAEAALSDEAFVAESVEQNTAGLRRLDEGLRALGLAPIPSVANFVTVDAGRPAQPVFEALLAEGVIVRPIGGYGLPRHLRITVGSEADNARLLEALARVLDA